MQGSLRQANIFRRWRRVRNYRSISRHASKITWVKGQMHVLSLFNAIREIAGWPWYYRMMALISCRSACQSTSGPSVIWAFIVVSNPRRRLYDPHAEPQSSKKRLSSSQLISISNAATAPYARHGSESWSKRLGLPCKIPTRESSLADHHGRGNGIGRDGKSFCTFRVCRNIKESSHIEWLGSHLNCKTLVNVGGPSEITRHT